ncbi:hypothetical protein AC1031_004764 [Aphanomyces cochlioides]|nr:hypothetical protein AC1031_004764 [Aphanomyces cochlioides]
MGFIGLLHAYGLVRTFRRRRRGSPAAGGPWASVLCVQTFAKWLTESKQLPLFHSFEVVCHSYQAYRMSFYLVDHMAAFSFAAVTSLYCLVIPWCLFASDTFVRKSLVSFIASALSFVLATAFPIGLYLSRAFQYVFVDPQLRLDSAFITTIMLLGRYLVVSSPLDLMTKVTQQLSSFLAVCRLADLLRPPRTSTTTTTSAIESKARLNDSFGLQFNNCRLLILYLVVNLIWGAVILLCAGLAMWKREICPTTCVLSVAPWFDVQCNCVYSFVNCATQATDANFTMDNVFNPDLMGTSLLNILIARCPVRDGIPVELLAPFKDLNSILFSNMKQWPAPGTSKLPDSLSMLSIRYSNLTTIPDVVCGSHVPSYLDTLRIEGAPGLSSVPLSCINAWTSLSILALPTLNLTEIPDAIVALPNLQTLEFRGNNLTRFPLVPEGSLKKLKQLDLSANALQDAPWSLASTLTTIELSSNPIFAVPSSIASLVASRKVILDDTPYCQSLNSACYAKCARLCLSSFVGDKRCDWECYNAACQFDRNDCAKFGFFDSTP